MAARSTEAYLKTQVLTAPPEKLQLMLYEGALRFARQAGEKIQEGGYEGSYELLVKAQNIVLELICGLRPEHNPLLCNKMAALYSFVFRRLVEANVRHDMGALEDALSVLSMMRDNWLTLLDKLAEERGEGAPAEVSVNARA
ncbi:MAG: flagellar export chaperone FliS [Planctomycetota bacterium]|jgi:flagellar protein FliS